MYNKTISWNDNSILIFICFVGRLLLDPYASSSSSFMTSSFLIQILKMDKRFFKHWVIRIPHRLRDLLWMVRAWSSVAPIFSSHIISRASSSSQSPLKVIASFWHTFLAWMDSHDFGRPFKVAITTFAFFTSSFTASICSLTWETLVKYGYMVSSF